VHGEKGKMQAKECKTISELMEIWGRKKPCHIKYTVNKKEQEICIDHKNDFFIPDGIVDCRIWNSLAPGKRVLFVLKEAYEDNHEKSGWALNDELREYGPWSTIWNRVAEWSFGIQNSDINTIAPYSSFSWETANEYLRRIAIMNIKKSGGMHSSIYEEISAYAITDAEEIIREIELIDPDIIICGATFSDINTITGNTMIKGSNENWFYYSDAIGGKERLFIDYYHPANRYPKLLNYYGIVGIYQQALKFKH